MREHGTVGLFQHIFADLDDIMGLQLRGLDPKEGLCIARGLWPAVRKLLCGLMQIRTPGIALTIVLPVAATMAEATGQAKLEQAVIEHAASDK